MEAIASRIQVRHPMLPPLLDRQPFSGPQLLILSLLLPSDQPACTTHAATIKQGASVQAYGICASQVPGLFSRSDPSGDGFLTRKQIGDCFSFIGIYLSSKEIQRVTKYGETAQKDRIEYPKVRGIKYS